MKPLRKKQKPSGVAAVEFAVIAPVLVFFIFGIIEITSGIYLKQSLTIAAYEGARVALIPDSNSENVAAACDRILQSRGIQGAQIGITPASFQDAAFGQAIRVQVSAPVDRNVIFSRFFSSTEDLTASVTMMKEL